VTTRSGRLVRRSMFVDDDIWRRIAERAKAEGVSIGRLVRRLLIEGIERGDAGSGGIAKTKADRLLAQVQDLVEEVRDQAALIGAVGQSAIGVQQLLVFWASRDGGLGVSQEELMAQLQVAGAEAWQQVLDELRAPAEGKPDAEG
jgi:hypothetical protein